jgi:hypothetical protein
MKMGKLSSLVLLSYMKGMKIAFSVLADPFLPATSFDCSR